MKHRIPLFALALLAVLGLAVVQVAAQSQHNAQPKNGKEMTVTGCLVQGAEANQYQLTATNGKTYNLMPEGNINLADHVGHKVKITGMREATQTGTETGAMPAREELRVTNLQHISKTCP